MLDARFVYERELQECRESFGSVDWRSAHLDETKIICPECGSSLMVQACPENTSIENIQATCRQCGEGIEAEKLIEAALEKHFEFDSYIAATDGGEQPLYDCPECTIKAYVISEDENACVWCGLSLEKCWRCHTTLTPNNVSPDSNNLCDYCNHIMSKDD
jgi:hypothetical protein